MLHRPPFNYVATSGFSDFTWRVWVSHKIFRPLIFDQSCCEETLSFIAKWIVTFVYTVEFFKVVSDLFARNTCGFRQREQQSMPSFPSNKWINHIGFPLSAKSLQGSCKEYSNKGALGTFAGRIFAEAIFGKGIFIEKNFCRME